MKNKRFILFITLICAGLLALMSSCEKEFNPRADYKDITIVYGMVNPVDDIHYIRIHKAFLGPENILDMAENPDSSLYPVEDLDVRVFEITPGGGSTKLNVDTMTITNKKEPGYFYYPNQIVYFFKKKFNLNTDLENTIKIEVENKKTGKIVYAETPLVNSFSVKSPMTGARLNLDPKQVTSKFEWNNAKHGRMYDVYYTLRYQEGRNVDPTDKFKIDSVVWHVGTHYSTRTGDGTSQAESFQFNPAALYSEIERKVAYDTSLWRRPFEEVRLSIWCGSEDLYYYHNINKPSGGIAQERPEFTNLKTKQYSEEYGTYQDIENEAFGIFTSRLVQHVSIRISDRMYMIYLPETDRQFKSVFIN